MKQPLPPKSELAEEVAGLLKARYLSPYEATDFLLGIFSTFDLVAIRDALKKERKSEQLK